MAVYKVPQDVEAEDKFLGPLTFKQFLYGGGVVITGYIMFLLISKGVAPVAFIFLPFFIFFGVLAFPWNKDQPTDIWVTSRIRFILFPRKRIWDQSGVKNLVTVTAPVRERHIYSDGLGQDQVRSRFSALASVIDSRGWATKNLATADPNTDRLVAGNTATLPNTEKAIVNKTEDMLDAKTNPLAGQFDTMIKKSEDSHRKATLDMLNNALHEKDAKQPPKDQNLSTKNKLKEKKNGKTEDYWFLNQPAQQTDPNLARIKDTVVVSPGQNKPTVAKQSPQINKADEEEFLSKVHKRQAQEKKVSELGRIKTIQPLSTQKKQQVPSTKPQNVSLPAVVDDNTSSNNDNANDTGATPVDAGIIALAHNDDLNIETIARQANKNDDGEVVINLH